MSRAERRRAEKSTGKKPVYMVTEEQLDLMIKERLEKEWTRLKQTIADDTSNEVLSVLFTLPMEVLMDDFWPKTYDKKIPKFTEKLLKKYDEYQNGKVDVEALKEKLWTYAGVKLIVED